MYQHINGKTIFIVFKTATIASGMNDPVENVVDQLRTLRDERLGSGRYGSVFPGKFLHFPKEVAIKKMEKTKVRVDSRLYVKLNGQPNVIGYYGSSNSTDDLEFV